MKVYDSNNLRNIAILGHSGCGKTNLIEAITYTANLTNKIPQLSDKTNMTYSMGLVPVEYNGIKYNLLDTPGYSDFCGEVISSLRACAAAVIVIDATSPIQVGIEKSLELTENMPKIMFINKIDNEKARYKDAIDMLREKYDKKIVPMIIPEYKDKKFVKLHNILENLQEAFDGDFTNQVLAVKEGLMELVAEADDAYLDKYFSGEEFTEEELQKGITIGIKRGDIIPVICGSTVNNIGTKEILETLESYIYPGHVDDDAPFKGQVFKTMVDPFTGKMSYIKVLEGSLKKDTEIINITEDKKEKISNIYTTLKGDLVELEEAKAGDIVVVTKVASLKTGDTLSTQVDALELDPIELPKPQIYYAIVPKNKGDEEKIASCLNKVAEEDPTIHWYRNPETKQTLVGGQGELHINTVKKQMKDKYGVDFDLEDIKVAYRETIKGSSDVQGKHKKQSGGRGQYGDVKIRFSRSTEDFEFAEEIFGGSVPKSYIPAVEKGLRDSMQKGILAGYPVTNIKAVLYDGSYHDVDSSEMAFKTATCQAFKEGIMDATPILLEPIATMKVVVPEKYTGDVMGDLNRRRGRVYGMNSLPNNKQEIVAEIPMSEICGYSTDLRSMTMGIGVYSYEFNRYEAAPSDVQARVVEESKK